MFLKRLILSFMLRSAHKLLRSEAKVLTVFLMLGVCTLVYGAKGEGESKNKKGYVLKVNGFDVKNNYLSPFALMQQGATYKGTLNSMQGGRTGNSEQHSIITYQKGNTIYIYPVQSKSLIQKFKTPSRDN